MVINTKDDEGSTPDGAVGKGDKEKVPDHMQQPPLQTASKMDGKSAPTVVSQVYLPTTDGQAATEASNEAATNTESTTAKGTSTTNINTTTTTTLTDKQRRQQRARGGGRGGPRGKGRGGRSDGVGRGAAQPQRTILQTQQLISQTFTSTSTESEAATTTTAAVPAPAPGTTPAKLAPTQEAIAAAKSLFAQAQAAGVVVESGDSARIVHAKIKAANAKVAADKATAAKVAAAADKAAAVDMEAATAPTDAGKQSQDDTIFHAGGNNPALKLKSGTYHPPGHPDHQRMSTRSSNNNNNKNNNNNNNPAVDQRPVPPPPLPPPAAAAVLPPRPPTRIHDDDDVSEATEGASNKTKKSSIVSPAPYESIIPARPFVTRYTLKLNLEKSDESWGTLIATLSSVIDKLRESDKKIIIYPYSLSDQVPFSNRLTRKEQLVKMKVSSQLQKYFSKISPRRDGGNMYCEFLMGHCVPFTEIHGNLDYWLKENKHGLWHRKLQQEETQGIGWLLYSHSNLNARKLAAAVEEQLGFDIDMRWRMISIPGMAPGTKITAEQRIAALHVDIPKDEFTARNAAKFQKLYSSQTTVFPSGVHMRLIPARDQARNFNSEYKMEQARARQAIFLHNLMHATTASILSIDFVSIPLQQSLRQYIMQIPSGHGVPLFQSIDNSWQGGFAFHYSPAFAKRAQMLVSGGLLPYLIYKIVGDKDLVKRELAKWFTPEAMLEAETCRWNPTEKRVENKADDALNALDNDPLVKVFTFETSDDFNKKMGIVDLKAKPTDNKAASSPRKKGMKSPKKNKKNLGQPPAPGDADSISTFGHHSKKLKANTGAPVGSGDTTSTGSKSTGSSKNGKESTKKQGMPKNQSDVLGHLNTDDDDLTLEDEDDDDDADDNPDDPMLGRKRAAAAAPKDTKKQDKNEEGEKDKEEQEAVDDKAADDDDDDDDNDDDNDDDDDEDDEDDDDPEWEEEPSVAQSAIDTLTSDVESLVTRMTFWEDSVGDLQINQSDFKSQLLETQTQQVSMDIKLNQILTLLNSKIDGAGEGPERLPPGGDT